MNLIRAALAATLFVLFSSGAQAVTVSAGNPAIFEIDLSSQGEVSFTHLEFSCYSCTGDERIQSRKRYQVDIGSTPGGNDIYSRTSINNFGHDVSNLTASIATGDGHGGIIFPSAAAILDAVYVTFSFVDDVFGVETASLIIPGGPRINYLHGEILPPTVVPLPAPALLLGGALLGLGVLARGKHAIA